MASIALLFGAILLYSANVNAETEEFCSVRIESPKGISFSETERLWICGDPTSEAWSTIPVSQKKLFLKNFLQSRGFHNPKFKQESNLLIVDAGVETKVKEFRALHAPPELIIKKRRRLLGQTLSPAILSDVENWIKREMQYNGYPCPALESKAIIDEGAIEIDIKSGDIYHFTYIPSEGEVDIQQEILERFTAFREGQRFDIRLLELSSRRILEQGLYTSTFYDVICSEDQTRIVRRFIPALPRLLTVGVGADTEQGPRARARFRRVRIGHAANVWESKIFASFRQQNLTSRFRWHFSRDLSSRLSLLPQLTIERKDEKRFETVSFRFGSLLGNGWEQEQFSLDVEAGPILEQTTTYRGVGKRHKTIGKIATQIDALSHMFEFYSSSPRAGWRVQMETTSQFPGYFAEQFVHRAWLRHHVLFNIAGYDPPLLILGLRGYFASFFLNQRELVPPDIPISDRFFLGGDDDIRGFARQEIPNNDIGFFTALYEGIELRAGEWFSIPLQPFIFFDIAKGGSRSRHLEAPLYYAPGTGLRYDSLIGTIRSSLGYGLVSGGAQDEVKENLQFFFSFGKEF